MKPSSFIHHHITGQLIIKGASKEDALILADDSVAHWKEVSHCSGGMFQYLLIRAYKRYKKAEKAKNEK